MNWAISLLLTASLFAFFGERSVSAQDWLGDLLSDVSKINERVQSDVRNINERVQSDVRNINERVQSDVRKINEQVHRDVSNARKNVQNDVRLSNERIQNNVNQIQENLSSELERINQHVSEQVSNANQQVEEAIKRGESGPSSSLIVSGNAASSRSFRTSVDANGRPYQIESENLVVGKTLFHTDRVYNYTSKILEERRYTLDLSDPNAKPVYSNVTRTPFKA